MPAWVKDEKAWKEAKKAVDKSKYDTETYWKIVASVYKKIINSKNVKKSQIDTHKVVKDVLTDMVINGKDEYFVIFVKEN